MLEIPYYQGNIKVKYSIDDEIYTKLNEIIKDSIVCLYKNISIKFVSMTSNKIELLPEPKNRELTVKLNLE